MTAGKKAICIFKWVFIIVMLVLIYLPILMIVVYSFINTKYVGGSGVFTLELYKKMFYNQKLMKATANTLIIGLCSSAIATIIGTLAAVGIFYLKRGKAVVNTMSQITVINAEIVTAAGFFLLVIFLRDVIKIPIKKDLLWLIITHSVITIPYVILAVSPRLTQLNPNLFEAGMDLGAGPMRTLITVIFPQLVKGMISGFAIAFTLSLDDFIVTKMNAGSGIQTISTFVYDNIKRNLGPEIRALSTLIFVAVMAILIIINLVGKKSKKKGVNR